MAYEQSGPAGLPPKDPCERAPLAEAAALAGTVVIVPAHNEEQALPLVLRDLPAVGEVIVIDNASTDRTAAVAAERGATVVVESRRGYGAACLAGVGELLRRERAGQTPPRVVAFIDGDYSDYPEHLPRLVEPISAGRADMVLGSRLAGRLERGAMPWQSRFGNRLACRLMRVLWGARYTDLGPFRAIRYSSLLGLGMADRGYGWTIEMQIKAAARGLRVLEVPVDYRRRIGTSKISGTLSGSVKAGYRILTTIGAYALRERRRGPRSGNEP